MWTVKCVRIYTGPDKRSYFEDLQVPMDEIIPVADDFDIRRVPDRLELDHMSADVLRIAASKTIADHRMPQWLAELQVYRLHGILLRERIMQDRKMFVGHFGRLIALLEAMLDRDEHDLQFQRHVVRGPSGGASHMALAASTPFFAA